MLTLIILGISSIVFIGTTFYIMDKYKLDIIDFIYLLTTKGLKHHIAKLNLVKGDLVFVNYRGKLRRAYIKSTYSYSNRFDLEFEESKLNINYSDFVSFPFSRIYVPEYVSIAAKVLYGITEE